MTGERSVCKFACVSRGVTYFFPFCVHLSNEVCCPDTADVGMLIARGRKVGGLAVWIMGTD